MRLRDVIYDADDLTECILAFLMSMRVLRDDFLYKSNEDRKEIIKKWVEEEWEPYKFKKENQ